MTITLEIPELGDGDIEGTAINLRCAPGDIVAEDQILLEVETDKVVVEIPATSAGTVEAVLINEGDNVKKGTAFVTLSAADSAETASEPEAETDATAITETTSVTLNLPALGDGDVEGTVLNLNLNAGDTISEGDTLLEVETDKVVVEIPAEVSGTVESVLLKNGDNAKQGLPFLQVLTAATDAPAPAAPASKPESTPAPTATKATAPASSTPPQTANHSPASQQSANNLPTGIVPAGPASRRLARELGVDIAAVQGSGPRGRINKDDVKQHVKTLMQNPAAGATLTAPLSSPELPDLTAFGSCHREPMTRIQQATAANMVRSAQTIPHAWIEEKIDITDIEASRKRLKERVKAQGGSLTMTTFLCKAVANALKQFPIINACIDTHNNEIVYRDYVNVGVAADTPRGLLVPVIHNTDQKSIVDIAVALAELSGQARDGALTADALKGGSFTISNLGGIGVTSMNPVVNWPEVAILGVTRAEWEPRLQDGEFVPRLMLPITLGFDHRVVNGADGARFLQAIREQLEDTACLALNC